MSQVGRHGVAEIVKRLGDIRHQHRSAFLRAINDTGVRALRGHLLGDTDDTKSEASDIRAILKARKVRCYRFERTEEDGLWTNV